MYVPAIMPVMCLITAFMTALNNIITLNYQFYKTPCLVQFLVK